MGPLVGLVWWVTGISETKANSAFKLNMLELGQWGMGCAWQYTSPTEHSCITGLASGYGINLMKTFSIIASVHKELM